MSCFSFLESVVALFFFFNDTATTEIYTLSLHDALPISSLRFDYPGRLVTMFFTWAARARENRIRRSEEHTSELQSRLHLVCRLLLEKKKDFLRRWRGAYKIDFNRCHDRN